MNVTSARLRLSNQVYICTLHYHGLIFTGLAASRVPRFAPLVPVEFALAAWARQFELFTSGLTSQHRAGHQCDSCGKLNVYFVVQFTF